MLTWKSSLKFWAALVAGALSLNAQSADKMVLWEPGMDHEYADGVLWLRAEVPERLKVAVAVSADSNFVAVELRLSNPGSKPLDILPDRFSLTLNQPQTVPMTYVTPDRAPKKAILATTLKPGQELRGTSFYAQEPVCRDGAECKMLLTLSIEDAIFIFPLAPKSLPGNDTKPTGQPPASPPPTAAVVPTQEPTPAHVTAALPAPRPAKGRNWQIGKVLDAATARTFMQTGSSTTASTTIQGNSADTQSQTVNHTMAIRETELLIVGDQFAYSVADTRTRSGEPSLTGSIINAVSNRHHGCRYIVNDHVRFYQDKATLHVIDVDGKECKTDVLRQERLK